MKKSTIFELLIKTCFELKKQPAMNATLYYPIFIYSLGFIVGLTALKYINSPGCTLQDKGSHDFFIPLLLCLLYAFFLGSRPVSNLFGDTLNYAREYSEMEVYDVNMNWRGEWIWQWFMVLCRSLDLPLEWFFTFVDLVYFLSVLWAIKILMPENVMLGILFVMSSLMFYTFGVNGIRNGVACHLLLLGVSFVFCGKYVVGCVIGIVAFGIHRSTALPIGAFVAALLLLKNVKYSIYFWLACIPLSLVAGSFFISILGSLGFDDRMSQYSILDESEGFSSTGFRWDFLLYSSMPVVMAWWVCVKKNISDNWYNALCTMYCLCNAFWILVIQASFSNRFAYLSWFMYPIIIAYPLIMLPVWEDQDQKIGLILFVYMAFTLAMSFIWGML